MSGNHLLLVGNPEPAHVGGHLHQASASLPITTRFADVNKAFAAPRLWRFFCWRVLGHRPPQLARFSAELLSLCRAQRPDWLLTVGLAPVDAATLKELRGLGVTLLNFLTDDPWNPQHHAPWFMRGLPLYDHVFTPRQANMPELSALGGPAVHYLPFAYAPDIHFPPPLMTAAEQAAWRSEVLFIGGADAERVATVKVLERAGHPLSLWGGYWRREPELARYAHGHAGPEEFRKLVASAAVNLCLVRKANRDGHSMRSFELAAVGGCMLVEDTAEHRSLFGGDLECVAYFKDDASMLSQARHLLDHPETSAALGCSVHDRITGGKNTYLDRLRAMLAVK